MRQGRLKADRLVQHGKDLAQLPGSTVQERHTPWGHKLADLDLNFIGNCRHSKVYEVETYP